MKRIVINAITLAQLIKYMLEGEYTCEQLAELTGLHYVTVLRYARSLHDAGAAHIAEWKKDARGCDAIKVYMIGEGKDAKRRKLTSAEKQAAYVARKAIKAMNIGVSDG